MGGWVRWSSHSWILAWYRLWHFPPCPSNPTHCIIVNCSGCAGHPADAAKGVSSAGGHQAQQEGCMNRFQPAAVLEHLTLPLPPLMCSLPPAHSPRLSRCLAPCVLDCTVVNVSICFGFGSLRRFGRHGESWWGWEGGMCVRPAWGTMSSFSGEQGWWCGACARGSPSAMR